MLNNILEPDIRERETNWQEGGRSWLKYVGYVRSEQHS